MFYRIIVVCSNASPKFHCAMCRSAIIIFEGKCNFWKAVWAAYNKIAFCFDELYAYAETFTGHRPLLMKI